MKALFLTAFIVLSAVPASTAGVRPEKELKSKLGAATPDNPVVYLGKALDKKSGQVVDGYAIVHFAKNSNAKVKPAPTSKCYGFIADGAKWKTVESWVVDSVNTGGLDPYFVYSNLSYNISKWEDAADGKIGNSQGVNILGEGQFADYEINPDGTLNDLNEVTFAPLDDDSIIAVNTVWGNFNSPAKFRQIVEWDQVYNTYFSWSASGSPASMDFENISTHELGHAVGMGDLYTSSCSQETMYGYADLGQTDKRDLYIGDITGVSALY